MRPAKLGPLLVALAACGGDQATSPQSLASTAAVQATPQIAFVPYQVSVARGGTVTWVFGSTAHTVYFDNSGSPAHILGSNANVSVARQFTSDGTYSYHCTLHSGMTGVVVVGASSGGTGGGGNYPPPPYYPARR